jgi:hypothetical protein
MFNYILSVFPRDSDLKLIVDQCRLLVMSVVHAVSEVVMRERLYSMQHTCHTCLIPKRGGAFKLWFESHDGDDYQCPTCYLRGSNMMPEGYENISTMAELKKRMDELEH